MAAEKIVTESALAALASDAKRAIYDVLPGGSASGNPCNFDTDIAVPLKSLIANIVASGGGGTPSTPIPIVGHSELNLVRCGVNLLSATPTFEQGASISDSVLSLPNAYSAARWVMNNLPQGQYTFSVDFTENPSGSTGFVQAQSMNGTSVDQRQYKSGVTGMAQVTFTVTDQTAFRFAVISSNITGGTIKATKFLLNKGDSALPYAPYNGQTFTVSFGQTVYGGVYDANRGKVKCTDSYKNSFVRGSIDSSGKLYYVGQASDGESYGSQIIADILCNALPVDTLEGLRGSQAKGICFFNTGFYVGGYVGDEAALDTLLQTLEVAYPLATPIEIDVSELSVDTISGVNNITSDCNGDVAVEYRESVEKYVNDHSATRTDVVGTLTAGQTSITLSSTAITTSSTIEVFTDPEVPYNSLTVTSGQAVLTFDAQANNVSVKVRVT